MTEPEPAAGAARQIGEITAGPQGVLTREIGLVTGEVYLATQLNSPPPRSRTGAPWYGTGLDARTRYSAMTNDRISAHP
ncbi:hypothetical protein HS048_21700 [Planomonospora sp. ID91781]|uniref:hypothetical protein n=1 Tax=Planomonospora sp. ID91781 TaxID=2738135 RepID=UPI0018C3FC8E|nr:hypothetical protein [Planomonospora sp. ID91781]MBG0823348.1 hypothetical protein [Planomonospora sp. ID91781]